MSKERLEELKKKTTGKDYLWVIEYAKEQAERVKELEDFKRNAEQLYRYYHLSAKKSVTEKEELREQNKRYREAIKEAKEIAVNNNLASPACSDIEVVLSKALEREDV